MYTWGNNISGQLGVGDTNLRSSPTLVPGGLTWVDVVGQKILQTSNTGGGFIALSTDGRVYCWGDGGSSSGLNGDGTAASKSSPALVVGGIAPRSSAVVQTVLVGLTPGSAYTVRLNQQAAMFGQTLIANGPWDQLDIDYFN
jgi:alpha-tubulin suppressor-like RCC1 family protein